MATKRPQAKRAVPPRGAKKQPPIGSTAPGLITRADAARALGVSRSAIRYQESTSKLVAKGRNGRGEVVFSSEEFRRVAESVDAPRPRVPQKPGEIASAAFALFDDGLDWRDVVKRLQIVPKLARELLDDWKGAGHLVLPPEHVERLRAHGCTDARGRMDGATIVATLESLRDENRALRRGHVQALDVGQPTTRGEFTG